jgi:probable F420-dependent oxidoreductase
MKLGMTIRVMGEAAHRDTLLDCARYAEDAGIDELWVADHIAIPPDDAEGSNGHYLDPLSTLAWLAAKTERIGLGTAVLILPYRPALPTAKAVATIQDLSDGRLTLGVGIGWMQAEFRALGVERSRRGALCDDTLDLLRRCFDGPGDPEDTSDIVEENGQKFLFRPRPPRPRILVGGAPPHSLRRAVRYGDGWMPMSTDREQLAPAITELNRLAKEAGAAPPEVACLGGVDPDPAKAATQLRELSDLGVTRFLTGARYGRDPDPFHRSVDALVALRAALG